MASQRGRAAIKEPIPINRRGRKGSRRGRREPDIHPRPAAKKLIEQGEKKPLRIFTHISENDLRAKDPESTQHNWVMAGERTAAALKAKGYHYRFVFSRATGHCDGRVFNLTLADSLVWVWRGYHAE